MVTPLCGGVESCLGHGQVQLAASKEKLVSATDVRENRQTFTTPPTLGGLRLLLSVICDELTTYQVWPVSYLCFYGLCFLSDFAAEHSKTVGSLYRFCNSILASLAQEYSNAAGFQHLDSIRAFVSMLNRPSL